MFGSNSIKTKSINDWNKMIRKTHFISEFLFERNEFIKLACYLNASKSLSMTALLYQFHYFTKKQTASEF